MPYLLGASGPVTTQTTPSTASAFDASIFLTRACGYGECRILPISIPGSERSSAYLPWPVVLPAESTRATRLPMMEKSVIFLHPERSEGSLFPQKHLHFKTKLIFRPRVPRGDRAPSLRSGF